MEKNVNAVKISFEAWLRDTRNENNYRLLRDIDEIVTSYLNEKRKKLRRIDTLNRMLNGYDDKEDLKLGS
ncbi:ORF42 [Plodia interpunctella granulovirus]|uniref:ORF42 n=1 Tax=Plodia interpunctella granulovirus TaxID=262175 RepID=A0A1L5JH04_9BBAC|nr:ORF42 [Plodia interpunctella granulovirus]APO13926.1 ORF42 [Plodia interpunctella granulovirus]